MIDAATVFDAHVSYLRWATARAGGDVVEDGGMLLFASPHPLPFLVNGATRTDPSVPADAVVDRARDIFAARGRGFEVIGLGGRDDDLVEAARAAGSVFDHDAPLQVLAASSNPPPTSAPSGIDVRVVADAAGVADIVDVNVDAYAVYGMPADLFPAVLGDGAAILTDDVVAVVAYEDGRPVATAQVHLQGDVGYVTWVGARPDVGRRGLASLVTRAVGDAAFARGATAAVLMASPMGAPVYPRLGYVDVGALSACVMPAPS